MQKSKGLLNSIRQHDKLAISVSPKESLALSADEKAKFLLPNRLDFYFFVFVYKGSTSYTIDLETCIISQGQLLLALPNQIVTLPQSQEAIEYYKIGFDESTLALLPQQFASLLNPLMLEAQRKLRYSKLSIKELAYELGFNDPDYFCRLFKKSTGRSVSQFLESMD